MKPGATDFLRITAGAAVFFGVVILGLHYRSLENSAGQLASRATRLELVEQVRLAVALASEAEKSAVMADTDGDSRTFADQARASTAKAEQGRLKLEGLLAADGSQDEKATLAQFSQSFAELQRIDKELLDLAVRNSNLKAYSLAFGPAAAEIREMDAALARVAADKGASGQADNLRVTELADGARIAALRILALLPPHIAEESNRRMDEMEAAMAAEDRMVRSNLENLAALPNLGGNTDLAAAMGRYARFSGLRAQILKLSRENTNVRSLAISLSQKRKAMLVCEDALSALEQAIRAEPANAPPRSAPVSPR